MSLATVGESLDPGSTLEAKARPLEKQWRGDICRACKTNAHPRGYDPKSQLCWWCSFPNVGVPR